MTGWRIGWMLVPERLRRAVDILTGNFTICPPVLAQWAGLAAFSDASYDELDGHVRRYADNRRVLLDGLPRLGITELAPADGAFYVYADVGHLTDDTMRFCHELLASTGVAVAPGIDFDTVDGGRFIRLSFAGPGGEIEDSAGEAVHSAPPLTFLHTARPASLLVCSPTPAPSGPMLSPCASGPTEIRAEAGRLVARADATAWEGLAADAMRWHTRQRAAALDRTAALHDDAADALERHASAVDAVTGLVGDVVDDVVELFR